LAVLDRQSLPVQTGKICRSGLATIAGLGNCEVQAIEIGLAQAALPNLQNAHRLKLF
jgi:hypothetical protein